jgi:hypothetical protein
MMATAGIYGSLYQYLEHRYADTVVLTFQQIEDLLGFALPAPARVDPEWWTNPAPEAAGLAGWSDAWRLAHRTADPHLRAGNVVFERVS